MEAEAFIANLLMLGYTVDCDPRLDDFIDVRWRGSFVMDVPVNNRKRLVSYSLVLNVYGGYLQEVAALERYGLVDNQRWHPAMLDACLAFLIEFREKLNEYYAR